MDHGQYSIECVGYVSVVLFCSVPLSAVYGYGVDHMVSFGGLFHFSCSLVCSLLCFLHLSQEMQKGCWVRSPGVTI